MKLSNPSTENFDARIATAEGRSGPAAHAMLTADVRARVEPELKREAALVLKAAGLDLSTAIRLFLLSVVETGGMPIAVPRPDPQVLAAIKAGRQGAPREESS